MTTARVVALLLCLVANFFLGFGVNNLRGSRNVTQKGEALTLKQTNFLLIIFDDLRPELSIYGKDHMITPNFERLAARSITFDHAYCQIAVCNPSRDSMLTGLRPDTVGTLGFQASYKPHLIFPTQLLRSGYRTSGFGKIMHWDGNDREVWSETHYSGNWYDYQNWEWDHMNSSVMPDKEKDEKTFPDYEFASRVIASLRDMASKSDTYHMTAIGFKMPHTALHVPFKYFDMYRSRRHVWREKEHIFNAKRNETYNRLRFPPSSPSVAYRCCADANFRFMLNEGASVNTHTYNLADSMDANLPQSLHEELMWGYSAAITFVDKQLGRILDVIDELNLWNNLTIVLTADHGMHNGEKGLWEKWTTFDESTHVPLLIHHPQSKYQGQRFAEPVELIDVYPTIIDLLNAPFDKKAIYEKKQARHIRKFVPLAGKSLAPVVIGIKYLPLLQSFQNVARRSESFAAEMTKKVAELGTRGGNTMPSWDHNFALSQVWKCAIRTNLPLDPRNVTEKNMIMAANRVYPYTIRNRVWYDCDVNLKDKRHEASIMGYSMRTLDFRYTLWLAINQSTFSPIWTEEPWAEELYDHRNEKIGELGQHELINLATDVSFLYILQQHRHRLLNFLRQQVLYKRLNTTQFDEHPPPSWWREPLSSLGRKIRLALGGTVPKPTNTHS